MRNICDENGRRKSIQHETTVRIGAIKVKSYSDRKNSKGIEINIIAFFKELSRKLWIVIALFIVGAIIGGVVGEITKTETYTSTVSFVVNSATESGQVSSGEINAQINMAGTFSYILSSPRMKEAVVEKCPDKVSYGLVNKSIAVNVVSSTNVIVMSVTTEDPKISYSIANTVVDVYGDIVSEIYSNAKLTLCDRPVLSTAPNSNRSVVSLALMVGFIAAVACIIIFFIMFLVKDTVKSADELSEKLDVHILGSVQQVTNKNKTAKGLLVTDRKNGFSFIETYKAIRTKIENNSAKTGNKVFLVTSACENEGKTTACVNIALSIAQNGKKVLIIDADLRKPSVSKMLSLPSTDYGLSDVIIGNIDLSGAIKRINQFDVFVLADQKGVGNPSELLSTDRMETIIESVRKEFDYVLIDTAPTSVVTDTSVIAGFVDAAIVVVREDFAPYSRIQMTIEDLDSNGAEIIGCVFNADTSSLSKNSRYGKRYGHYGKGYKYGSYGSYGGYGSYGQSSKK